MTTSVETLRKPLPQHGDAVGLVPAQFLGCRQSELRLSVSSEEGTTLSDLGFSKSPPLGCRAPSLSLLLSCEG